VCGPARSAAWTPSPNPEVLYKTAHSWSNHRSCWGLRILARAGRHPLPHRRRRRHRHPRDVAVHAFSRPQSAGRVGCVSCAGRRWRRRRAAPLTRARKLVLDVSRHPPQLHVRKAFSRRDRPISPLNTHADQARTALGPENLSGAPPPRRRRGAGQPVEWRNSRVSQSPRNRRQSARRIIAATHGTRSARGMIVGRPVSHANDHDTRSARG
jgi:hypothetical protein